MKKVLPLIVVLSLFFSISSSAIGLPNNAFIHEKAAKSKIEFADAKPIDALVGEATLNVSQIETDNNQDIADEQSKSFMATVGAAVNGFINYMAMSLFQFLIG